MLCACQVLNIRLYIWINYDQTYLIKCIPLNYLKGDIGVGKLIGYRLPILIKPI